MLIYGGYSGVCLENISYFLYEMKLFMKKNAEILKEWVINDG
jgi:hypothetical protein